MTPQQLTTAANATMAGLVVTMGVITVYCAKKQRQIDDTILIGQHNIERDRAGMNRVLSMIRTA